MKICLSKSEWLIALLCFACLHVDMQGAWGRGMVVWRYGGVGDLCHGDWRKVCGEGFGW